MTFDKRDLRLLHILSTNGRATHQTLAEEVGRSPSGVARRQKTLEEAGVIAGYGAILDLARLDHATTVHIKVTLSSQRREILDAFEQAVAASRSVVRCDLMSGSDDYLVTVLARSLDDFARIHREELSLLPAVTRMESAFVLKQVVGPRLPPSLFPD